MNGEELLSFQVLALAVPAVLFAGISKAGFGSGAAFAGAAILALVVEPAAALGVMLPLLMVIDAAALRPYWKRWDGEAARLLFYGGVPGVALGAAIFAVVPANAIRLLIGAVCLLFVGYRLLLSRGWLPARDRSLPRWAGLLAGVGAGFTSFVSHAGGPVVAIYLLSRETDKTRYQATTVVVFWALNLAKFLPYALLGMFAGAWGAVALLLPVAMLGTWLGVTAHRLIPERLFFLLTYLLLSVTGARLIWVALN